MRLRVATGLWLAGLAVSSLATADDALTVSDLVRGDRVRLRLSSGGKTLNGTLDATGPDEMVVRPQDEAQPVLRLSPAQLAKLEVVRGRRSHWVGGAVIGFVPGALFTAYAVASLSECDPDCDHTGEALAYGLVGGLVTGTVGGLIGLAIKTDRWVEVDTRQPKVALVVIPVKGGFRAGLSIRF